MPRREIRWWWCAVHDTYHRWRDRTLARQERGHTKIGDYVPDTRLQDGESVEGLFDPQTDIPEEKGTLGGTVYTVLLNQGGKLTSLKGGKGLLNGIAKASLTAPGKPIKVRITAHGQERTTARTYDVKVVR